MTARNLIAAVLMVALAAVLVLLTGCGGGDPEDQVAEEDGRVTLTDPREPHELPALVPPADLPTCDPVFKVCR